jgi:hypothetical protein
VRRYVQLSHPGSHEDGGVTLFMLPIRFGSVTRSRGANLPEIGRVSERFRRRRATDGRVARSPLGDAPVVVPPDRIVPVHVTRLLADVILVDLDPETRPVGNLHESVFVVEHRRVREVV